MLQLQVCGVARRVEVGLEELHRGDEVSHVLKCEQLVEHLLLLTIKDLKLWQVNKLFLEG